MEAFWASGALVVKGKVEDVPQIEGWLKERLIARGHGVLVGVLEVLGIVPTLQQWPILTSEKRRLLICGGWRSGKSFTAKNYFWGKKEWGKKQLFWIGAASYDLCKREFDFIVEDARTLGQLKYASKRVNAPGYIELKDGTIIECKSATDPRSWAAQPVDGIIIPEAAQVDLDIYYQCLGRLAEKRGWLLMEGTLEGSLGWYPTFYELWQSGIGDEQSFSLPTASNTYAFPGGEDDPEILAMRRNLPDDVAAEKLDGKPVPPKGLVFPEFRPDIHVQPVKWEPELPVYMWVDPGFSDAAAYLFAQVVDGQVRVFAELYERGRTVSDIIQVVRGPSQWSSKYPFWKHCTGRGGAGLFATEDRYGEQHHHNSSVQEVWLSETGIYLSSVRVKSVNDVDAVIHQRLRLDPLTNVSGLMIDPACRGLISNFGGCLDPFDNQTKAYRWRADREGQTYGEVPEDKHNHSIKALGYGLVDCFGFVMAEQNFRAKVVYH